MNNQCVFLLVCASCAVLVTGQYSDDFDQSPVPPRLAIPGAAPVGRPQFRAQARRFPPSSQLVSDPVPPPPPIKIRRPVGGRAGRLNAGPSQLPQQSQPRPIPIQPQQQQQLTEVSIPPRPVIEDPEEQQSIDQQLDAFPDASPSPVINNIPSQLPSQQQSQPQLRPASPRPSPAVFRPERPPFIPTPTPDLDFPQPTRQQFRAQQAAQQQFQPTPSPPQFTRQQQQQQQQQTSSRQQQQLVRNQPQKQQQVQYVKYQEREKDRDREAPPRERKPVAQVLRRYREDNEDGSITWGFENDDGSFKEETIGVDCVTRGKYGYIDPDGVRREYSYSSGIPCDKTRDDNQEAATNEGYIDYQNNRYVFPNGDAIDLDKMVKNRARKPVQLYRN